MPSFFPCFSPHTFSFFVRFSRCAWQFWPSQRPLEEWRGDQQRADAEGEEEEQVVLDGDETAVLQQDGLKAVDGIGEGIDDGDDVQPGRERRRWDRWRPRERTAAC